MTAGVCAAYLAMAGLKVVALDQRPVVGGAAVAEEFSPGFSNSVASYAVSLLNPKENGDFLKVGGGQTKREMAADEEPAKGQISSESDDRVSVE